MLPSLLPSSEYPLRILLLHTKKQRGRSGEKEEGSEEGRKTLCRLALSPSRPPAAPPHGLFLSSQVGAFVLFPSCQHIYAGLISTLKLPDTGHRTTTFLSPLLIRGHGR